MRIKNLLTVIVIFCVMAMAMPARVAAATVNNTTTSIGNSKDPETDAQKAARIVNRVNEIQAMDKTNLSPDEKKALRKELMGLKKEATGLDSKVYLSVGAIIIIILLLILILR